MPLSTERIKARGKRLLKAVSFVTLAVAVWIFPIVSCDFDSGQAEARGKKKSAARVSHKKTSSSRSSRKESRSSKRSSRRETRAEKRSSRRDRSRGREDRHSRTSRKGHHAHHEHHAPPPPPPPPSKEQVEANANRESSYQTMARAYRLYDEGINARMSGDYNAAVNKLNESWKLFNDMRGYQRTGESSLNEAMVHYELGQAAESLGDILSARDSYVRCLNIRPTLVEASVRLVSMLATAGQWQLALAKAQDAVRANPNDARIHQLMSLTLSKTGHAEEARAEALKAQELLKAVPNYKPMGIDAVWKREHQDETSTPSASHDGDNNEAHQETHKSDVDNPEDVMGDDDEMEE